MRKIVLLLTLLVSISSFAQNAKIKELERKRKQALLEISNTDKLLRDTKKTTATLLNRIKLISNQISSRQKVVELLGQEIQSIVAEQKQTEAEIVTLEAELKDKQKNYAKAIDGMLRNRQNENKLLFVLSGKSLTESYRRLRYLREYSEWRSKQADEIKEKSEQLKEKKDLLAKTKANKQALLGQRETEQANLKTEETNYKGEVGEAQKKQKDLNKILAQKRQQAQALDKQIAKLIAEEVARQDREDKRKAAEIAKANANKGSSGATSSSGSKGTSSATATSTTANIKLSSNFAANKGKLPYPISGNYTIVNRFGTHQHNQWNVTTSSNGIDIQSQSGADARCVFDGEVSRVVAFPGYNNCVIVRHGNYYTFYGNIQTMYVKQGDKVKTGQALGKVYTDSDLNTSQLHFQLWQSTNKLNPEPWLR